MAEYVDPNPNDKYTHTQEGGIQVDDTFEEVGTVTDVMLKFTSGDDTVDVHFLRAGAQDLSTRQKLKVEPNRQSAGNWELTNDVAVDAEFPVGTYQATGNAVVAGSDAAQAKIRVNGDGDLRVQLFGAGGNTQQDPTADHTFVLNLGAVSDTNNDFLA